MFKALVATAAVAGVSGARLGEPAKVKAGLLTNTVSVCSGPGALATNFVVTVTPDTIVKGDTVSTVFEFDLSEEIAAGSVSYSGTYNGLPFSQSAELCAEVSKTGESCPLKAGHHYEVSKAVADYTGKLDTTIEWKAADGRQILCAKVVTKVA